MEVTVKSMEQSGACKCPRCWHYHYSTLNFGHCEGDLTEKGKPVDMREKLCNKCTFVIVTNFPEHPSFIHIMKNINARGLHIEDFEGLDSLIESR